MAIQSPADYVAAAKQLASAGKKTTTRTTVANGWFSLFDVAGSPGAGTLAGVNTANGVVPTDATAGYAPIDAFAGGAKGYLSKVDFSNTVACRVRIYDRLFVAGAYAFNANTALASQPSFSSRIPGGTDYKNLELWVEQVTVATGNQAVTVTYTNENTVGSRSTGAVGIGAAPTVGRCWQLPFQAGDCGIQKIDNVKGTVATAGTFNVMVLRRLWGGRVRVANEGDLHAFLQTGLPELFADSALYVLVNADSTSSGLPDIEVEIANK